MKISIFNVVELNNNKKATILNVKNNEYLVEVVDDNGKSLGNKTITTDDIKKVVFQK